MSETMATLIRQFLLIAAGALSISAHAQEAEPLQWPLDEFRTRCIPLWTDDPNVEVEDCTVAEFGEIAELDGSRFYYARYHDRTRPIPDEIQLPSVTEFNALVILRMDQPNRQNATVFHVRKQDSGSWFETFHAPKLLQTDRGPILHLAGRGLGAGRSQYDRHQYWLWRSGTWVALDVLSWIYEFRGQMPDGFGLGGIGDLATALRTMTYVDTWVRRDGDYMCCPTGGTIRIQFEWDDLTLRVLSFEHDPDAQSTE